MRIGEKLKKERLRKNLTQEQIADILKVARTTVSSWEVGRSYPDISTLVSLSDLYGLSLDTLLREDEEMVKVMTKEIQTGRNQRKNIAKLVGVIVIICLMLVVEHTLESYADILPVKAITKVDVINSSDEITKDTQINLIATKSFYQKWGQSSQKIVDGKLYITIYTDRTLFSISENYKIQLNQELFKERDSEVNEIIIVEQEAVEITSNYVNSKSMTIWKKANQ